MAPIGLAKTKFRRYELPLAANKVRQEAIAHHRRCEQPLAANKVRQEAIHAYSIS